MDRQTDFEKYDINHIVIKPLYLGLVMNIIVPAALIYVCYYLDTNQNWISKIGSFSTPLFYIIVALSLIQSGIAFYLRNQLLKKPLIKSEATFSEDLIKALMKTSRPAFALILFIAVYGFFFYLLSAEFEAALLLVVFSFIAFQFIRPRLRFAKKLIETQEDFVAQGKFLAE